MHIPDDDEWLGESLDNIPPSMLFKEVEKELDDVEINPNILDFVFMM